MEPDDIRETLEAIDRSAHRLLAAGRAARDHGIVLTATNIIDHVGLAAWSQGACMTDIGFRAAIRDTNNRSSMVTTMTVEQLLEAGGTDLGASDWIDIRQERVNLFADATDDHQWIHVDAKRAADGPFGVPVAHGYLTLGLIPRLLDDLLVVTDKAIGVNFGIEKVRFTSPVPVGSRVRMRATISDARRRGELVQYTVEVSIDIEYSDRPALVGSVVYLAGSDGE